MTTQSCTDVAAAVVADASAKGWPALQQSKEEFGEIVVFGDMEKMQAHVYAFITVPSWVPKFLAGGWAQHTTCRAGEADVVVLRRMLPIVQPAANPGEEA